MSELQLPRVLIVDDQAAIHDDYRKSLQPAEAQEGLGAMRAELFGEAAPSAGPRFELVSCSQGEEAARAVARSLVAERPFSVAFVDMRMPPGWDGLRTIEELWKLDPDLHCVLCTAYSDATWAQVLQRLGRGDRLLILKKPFEPIEVQQIARALSDKGRLERDARARAAGLEALVGGRTREVEARNLELAAALQRAQAACEAKSEFQGKLSRVIRGPLSSILEIADLLADPEEALAPEQRLEHARTLQERGRHLLGVIDDLFELSEVEAGRATSKRAEIDLHALIRGIWSGFGPLAKDRGLALEHAIEPGCPERVQTDERRLRQVLTHLVGRAIRSTASGSVRLKARAASATRIAIDVIDTGAALSKEEQSSWAGTSQRLDTATDHGRAEIGWTLTRGLAELIGGRIEVHCGPESGNRFTLEIPIAGLEERRTAA
jgi:two-component system, sensor histidine kinase and response regulator